MMLKAHEEAGGSADELQDEAGKQVESGDEVGAGGSVGAMHLVLSQGAGAVEVGQQAVSKRPCSY